MADEVVVEAPVAVEEAPVVVQPAVAPADIEEPVVKTGAKTIDSHEASVGWTVQQGDAPSEPESVPGNVVTYAELPYKASLVAAGVDLDQYHAGLVVVADDAERDAVQGVGTAPDGVPEVAADDDERASVLGEK
jgi:hypothetical protein